MGQQDNQSKPFVPQQQVHKHGTQSGAKVFVACKHDNGILIRGMTKCEEREPVLGGGSRDFPIYRPDNRTQEIKGPAVRYGEVAPITVGGYAFTDYVDKDLWDNWYEANKDGGLISDELIHAESSKEGIRDWASRRGSVLSGLEGIDPANPGKIIRGIYQGQRDS